MSHPSAETARIATRAAGAWTFHTTAGIGRQSAKSTPKQPLAISTYVLRSIGFGTTCVQTSLNPLRAIPLCCTAKRIRSRASTSKAVPIGARGLPESTLRGTSASPTNPTAYRIAPRNDVYARTP